MSKVRDISSGKKPEKSCQFCGKTPACPDWTCPRIASVTVDESGWQVEFVDRLEITFQPQGAEPEPNE
jgi:hypothetical protein